jgi:plasmid stabilization system protein ParE
MVAREFHLSPSALADLREIEDYLAERSADTADRVVDALFDTFRTLARNPDLGTHVTGGRRGLKVKLAAKPAHKYLILFYTESKGVMISHVLHSARNWTDSIERRE